MPDNFVTAPAPVPNSPDGPAPQDLSAMPSSLGGPAPATPAATAAPTALPAPTAPPQGGSGPAPAAPPAPPPPTPDQVAAHHNNLMGQAARFLLGNQSTYHVDPSTGQTVETPVEQKPGAFFRSILAGAILGGATGAAQVHTGSGVQGAAVGAGAAMQQQQGMDAARKAQAQQDFKNNQEVDSANQAKIYQAAQIANMNVNNIISQRQLDLSEKEHIDSLNTSSRKELDALDSQPGVQTPVIPGPDGKDLNGVEGAGPQLMAQYMKDQSLHTAPAGYIRKLVPAQVDTAGLSFDPTKNQWVDDKGAPVDMSTRTTNVIKDIPEDTMGKMISPGAEALNSLLGSPVYKPGDTPSVSMKDYLSLIDRKTQQDHATEDQNIKKRQANTQAAVAQSEISKNNAETAQVRQTTATAAAASTAANHDLTSQRLVEGLEDPSQLSKREKDYNAVLDAADAYSRQHYGVPFDIAKAQKDYKYANEKGTQDTLKYLKSLTGPDNQSGNLGLLINMSNSIPRTQFPGLNDAKQWAQIETGNPQIAAYHGLLIDVADQTAKIMGGGNGTVSGMKQAAELYDKGFTKSQILAVASTQRSALANRGNELIGDNRYLQRQFGAKAGATQTAPQEKPVYVQGKLTGYTTDGKTYSRMAQ